MNQYLLLIFLLLPLIPAIAVCFSNDRESAWKISFSGAMIQLLAVVLVATSFQTGVAGYQMECQRPWFPSWGINIHLGLDGMSLLMVILTSSVVLAGVLVSRRIDWRYREFHFLLHLLALGAYGFFLSLDMFCIFFFLELAVVPKFLLIAAWGSGKKEVSAMKLALVLMAGSGLVFIALAGIFVHTNQLDITLLSQTGINNNIASWIFPLAFTGFGIFTAIFPFHTWVPDGHSSAPTAGSMFLAGISMKLGGFGCIRMVQLMPEMAQVYSDWIIILALLAIVYGALATMMQRDLKYMNAYSSISHCGFVLLGIGFVTETALQGAVLQMISHGFMTALFFALIGMIYERSGSRDINALGGLMKVYPFIATAFFIAGLCSLGLPGLSGFIAEFTIFLGGWAKDETFYRVAVVLGASSIVITAVYILRATGSVMMGDTRAPAALSPIDAHWQEKLAIILLIAGILLLGLAPFLFQSVLPENIITRVQP